ncbi:MAG: hypothetical protein JEZ07_08050 [Phycisphaerae bacterium]|nr:hypothetical protein [Phycisphaerae bacterium]
MAFTKTLIEIPTYNEKQAFPSHSPKQIKYLNTIIFSGDNSFMYYHHLEKYKEKTPTKTYERQLKKLLSTATTRMNLNKILRTSSIYCQKSIIDSETFYKIVCKTNKYSYQKDFKNYVRSKIQPNTDKESTEISTIFRDLLHFYLLLFNILSLMYDLVFYGLKDPIMSYITYQSTLDLIYEHTVKNALLNHRINYQTINRTFSNQEQIYLGPYSTSSVSSSLMDWMNKINALFFFISARDKYSKSQLFFKYVQDEFNEIFTDCPIWIIDRDFNNLTKSLVDEFFIDLDLLCKNNPNIKFDIEQEKCLFFQIAYEKKLEDTNDALPRPAIIAYNSYGLAESELGKCTDRQAHEWLKINGPEEYKLSSFDTWCRNLRTARKHYGASKHTPRAGRNHKAIVTSNQIDLSEITNQYN